MRALKCFALTLASGYGSRQKLLLPPKRRDADASVSTMHEVQATMEEAEPMRVQMWCWVSPPTGKHYYCDDPVLRSLMLGENFPL